MLHYAPQRVSSSTLLIIRRTNCITTASGIITFFYLLHSPLLGVILHAYIKCTKLINNIDTIIVTLPVVFTGSLTDIYNLLLYISCFVLFCVHLGMGDPLRS